MAHREVMKVVYFHLVFLTNGGLRCSFVMPVSIPSRRTKFFTATNAHDPTTPAADRTTKVRSTSRALLLLLLLLILFKVWKWLNCVHYIRYTHKIHTPVSYSSLINTPCRKTVRST
jgi:hypothetical protein